MSLIVTSNLTEVEMDGRGFHFRTRQSNLSLSPKRRGLIRRSFMIGDNIGICHVTGRFLGRVGTLYSVHMFTIHVMFPLQSLVKRRRSSQGFLAMPLIHARK
jgi:hypothetical protein